MKLTVAVLMLCLAAANAVIRDSTRLVQRPSANSDDIPWSDCSGGKSVIKINSLKISPSTVNIPGNVVLEGANVEVTKPIAGPIKVHYQVKFGGVFPVPCSEIGGHDCTVDDLCPVLKTLKCPKYLTDHGLPCHCPIAAGNYTYPKINIPIPPPAKPLPSLVNNKFAVEAKLTDAQGNSLLCIDATVTLHAASQHLMPSKKWFSTRSASFRHLRQRLAAAGRRHRQHGGVSGGRHRPSHTL